MPAPLAEEKTRAGNVPISDVFGDLQEVPPISESLFNTAVSGFGEQFGDIGDLPTTVLTSMQVQASPDDDFGDFEDNSSPMLAPPVVRSFSESERPTSNSESLNPVNSTKPFGAFGDFGGMSISLPTSVAPNNDEFVDFGNADPNKPYDKHLIMDDFNQVISSCLSPLEVDISSESPLTFELLVSRELLTQASLLRSQSQVPQPLS
jgi:hypothetical protein